MNKQIEDKVKTRIMLRSAMNCCNNLEYLLIIKEICIKDDFPYKIKRNYVNKINRRIKYLYGDLELER